MNIFKGKRTDEWGTPKGLFKYLDDRYNFTHDLAASPQNKKCKSYSSDSLLSAWWVSGNMFWLNPPFSKAKQFYEKAAKEQPKLVSIYKSANLETELWQDIILPNCNWVCFIKGRVNYEDEDGIVVPNVPFGSALIGYNVECKVKDLGRVWCTKTNAQ